MTVALTEKMFDRAVASGLVIIDWWAAWCGPCRVFAPVFEAASARHPTVVFAKVDADVEHALARRFGISALPTLQVFRDGVEVFRRPGMLDANRLDLLVEHLQAENRFRGDRLSPT